MQFLKIYKDSGFVTRILFFTIYIIFGACSCNTIEVFEDKSYYSFNEEKRKFSKEIELGSIPINIKSFRKKEKKDYLEVSGTLFSSDDQTILSDVRVFLVETIGEELILSKELSVIEYARDFNLKIPNSFQGKLIFWKPTFLSLSYNVSKK